MLDLMDPDHAYFFGLLQTDGHHYGDVEHKGKISLEMKYDDSIELFQRLQKMMPWDPTITERTRNTNFKNDAHSAILGIFDQGIRQEFLNAGLLIGEKSFLIKPPTRPFNKSAYLRGVFDGDGSVGFTAKNMPFVSLVCPSKNLVDYVVEELFLEIGGIVRNPSIDDRGRGCYNVMVANEAAAKVAGYLYPNFDVLGLPRKVAAGVQVSQWTIPEGSAWRYGVARKAWTAEEDELVMQDLSFAELEERLGRTQKSINARRCRLRKKLNQS